MKKLLFATMVLGTIIGCTSTNTKTNTSDYPENAVGYNLDSSANIDLVKKMVQTFEAMDSANYRSTYAENAKFHDNGHDMTLEQNIGNFNFFKSKGITIKMDKIDPIWEAVNKTPSPDGVTNYVISFQHMTLTKGDKHVKVIMNVVNGMKNGKIVEEWGLYDASAMYEIMK